MIAVNKPFGNFQIPKNLNTTVSIGIIMSGDLIHDVRFGGELKKLARMEHVEISPEVKSEINRLKDDELAWVAFEINDKAAIHKVEVINSEWFRKNLLIKDDGYTGDACTT